MSTTRKSRSLLRMILGLGATAAAFAFVDRVASARTPDSIEQRNQAVVAASFEAWRGGTGSPFDLLADDARWTIEGNSVAAGTYPGKESFLAEVIRPFNARMRERLKPTVRSLYADGDTVIVLFDARGVARDGKPYVNSYAWFLDLRDGRIVRASAFFDAIAFNDFWARVSPAD
jgi:ketosteroid isomerase-like protein